MDVATKISVVAFLLALMLFEYKRPKLEGEQIFRTAIYTGSLTAFIIACFMILPPFFGLRMRDIFSPLCVFIVYEFVIGIIQPYFYILSKEQLKLYTSNVIIQTIVNPFVHYRVTHPKWDRLYKQYLLTDAILCIFLFHKFLAHI